MKRKTIALLLALALLALTACGGTKTAPAAQESAPETTAETAEAPAETEQEPAQDTAQEPVSETPQDSTPEPAQEPAPEAAQEPPAPDPAEQPVQDSPQAEPPAEDQPQLQEGEWMTPGEGMDADGRGPDEEEDPYGADFEPSEGAPIDPDAITEGQFDSFTATVPDASKKAKGFRDFAETMASDFTGTWYDPKAGEAFRITERGAYVYIPYLDLWGDQCCDWSLTDRSERGKCPQLTIYCFGTYDYGLTYYVAGNTGEYFWCVSQGQLFYKQ